MKSNFQACFDHVIKNEGGYVDHPRDPGGATNLGVTIGTLSDWLGRKATKAEVKALTLSTVAKIYRANYWDAVKGDNLPIGVDLAVFDFAINSGPLRAIIALQRAVKAADDGKLGPITLALIQSTLPNVIIRNICNDRINFMRALSTWPVFGRGWNARVTNVRTIACKMIVTQ